MFNTQTSMKKQKMVPLWRSQIIVVTQISIYTFCLFVSFFLLLHLISYTYSQIHKTVDSQTYDFEQFNEHETQQLCSVHRLVSLNKLIFKNYLLYFNIKFIKYCFFVVQKFHSFTGPSVYLRIHFSHDTYLKNCFQILCLGENST